MSDNSDRSVPGWPEHSLATAAHRHVATTVLKGLAEFNQPQTHLQLHNLHQIGVLRVALGQWGRAMVGQNIHAAAVIDLITKHIRR